MTAEQLAAVRRDFELEILFHSIPSLPVGPGCLVRQGDDVGAAYRAPHMEYAWQGYLRRARSENAQLARFNPDRHIGNGDRTTLREICGFEPYTDDALDSVIRAVLKHFGGMPA